MMVADAPVAHATAKLLVVSETGDLQHHDRDNLPELLRPGDLLVANDAATIPASLRGTHERTGSEVEIRLAGRPTLRADDVHRFVAVVFGAGDWRTPSEDRPPPPALLPGDRLRLGPLRAGGPASLCTVTRSSTRTCPSRSRCGTCGPRWPRGR